MTSRELEAQTFENIRETGYQKNTKILQAAGTNVRHVLLGKTRRVLFHKRMDLLMDVVQIGQCLQRLGQAAVPIIYS